MSLRAAIYARVSTDVQRENYSIPSQIQEILRYAQIRNLSLVGDRFVDPGTGKDTLNTPGAIPAFVDDYTSTELSRPGLNACLSFLNSKGFDVLIVHAIDRLARDPYFRQTIEREVAALGAKVEYVLGNYDESPEGEVRKDLDATFAKWENAKRVERTNRGKKRKAEMGKLVAGLAPYGYRIDRDAFGGMAVYEPEAQVIQMMFRWYVEMRLSVHQIVRELDNLGIKTYQNFDTWSVATICKMLTNTAYIGYFFYNQNKRHGKKMVKRDESEWTRIECTPLVPVDVFEAAQEILKENKERLRKQPRHFYLLAGMVVCAECRRPYLAQTITPGKSRKQIQQGYRHRLKHGHCSNRWITTTVLDPLVWDRVVNILLNPMSLREGYEQNIEQERQKQARQIKHLETLELGIEKLQAKKARLQAIYLDPDIGMTKDDYLSEKKLLEDQIKAAKDDAEKIGKELKRVPTESDLKNLEIMASSLVEALGNNLDISPQDKRHVLEMLNLKVLISSDRKIKLEGWFTPESDGFSSTASACWPRRSLHAGWRIGRKRHRAPARQVPPGQAGQGRAAFRVHS
jgi:site-specific DNA recombinase